MAVVLDSEIWINELHYDNDGADEQEFVEVAAPAAFTDLSNVTLTLYNGNGGKPYVSATGLDSFSTSETVDGYTFYAHDVSLQNGAPDGLALTHGGDVLQFLSYEGQFTATEGPADTLLSTDIGVEETPSTPLGFSLQLAGTGDSYLDFSWQAPATHTRGTLNQAQSVVPEPSSLLLGLTLAMVSLLFWRRWRPGMSRGTR
ncbi:MAG: PEP-CTERM sorting domain-containing protein [Planctomycetota bacterium]